MRTQNEKNKFIEELKEIPIVSVVCKRTGIAKSTFYRWMKDSVFNEKVQDAEEVGRFNVTDIAEGQLISAMRKGEKWAIQYWLESNSKRYVRPRKPASHSEVEKPREINSFELIHTHKFLTQEQADIERDKYLKEINKNMGFNGPPNSSEKIVVAPSSGGS